MSTALAAKLAALETMDLEGLRRAWQAHCGTPTPLRSVTLLQLMLGWRLQAQSGGGLTRDDRRSLMRKGTGQCEGQALGNGAILRRTWQGQAVEVVVVENGFLWNGSVYRSLSAAASAIAGSRWNGPRFFGLREEAL